MLDERAAAAYIGVSTSSLRKGRMTGAREGYMQPPPYVKLGRSVRYLQSDLDQYLARFRHSGCEA
ncbi:MAG: helix-turn-helix domain-containing protein [Burkholderiales bacterium]|nr:helix-turn-helix domain-containing protein [Burkholderiales bacterium]